MTDEIKLYRAKPYVPEEDKAGIMERWKDILDTGMFIQGKYVSELERLVAKECGTKYAVATNSGATALEIGIRATGMVGKEILVPTQTFVATVSAIERSGNIPVIVDMNPLTHCMDFDIIKANMNSNVGGVMLVHLAGLITDDIETIQYFCQKNGLFLFEDASHAMGAETWGGQKAGALGDVGCFSLFATKIVTSGEGGIVTTNNEEIANQLRILRNHGCERNTGKVDGLDYGVNCTVASSNYRMPEFAAVLGISQMNRLGDFIYHRTKIAERYYSNLFGLCEDLMLPNTQIGHQKIMTWWQYNITFRRGLNRNEIAELLLKDYNVPTANAYWPACHQQPAFSKWISNLNAYPNADDVLNRHLSFPMYVEMTLEQVDYVCDSLKRVLNDS